MAEHLPLVGDAELGSVGELSRLADVMADRRRHQQVGVEAGMQGAGLEHQGRDRHRVLDQPAEVGVVAAAGAGRAAKPVGLGARDDRRLDDRAQGRIVDLADRDARESPRAPRPSDTRPGGTRRGRTLPDRSGARRRARPPARRESARPCPGRRSRRRLRSAARSGRPRERPAPRARRCDLAGAARDRSRRCARSGAPSTEQA